MKNFLILIACVLSAANLFSQGFSPSAINWALPATGGLTIPGDYQSYIAGYGSGSNTNGSNDWTTLDMNGDKKPDLVVYNEVVNSKLTAFQTGGNFYWKVYLNTGNGFAASPVNWSLPQGGIIDNGVSYSFSKASNSTAIYDIGSQLWELRDMDGDNRPDLLVYRERVQTYGYIVPERHTNPHWKVYLNTGNGFSPVATQWLLPKGGIVLSNDTISFTVPELYNPGTGLDTGSMKWALRDMTGDNAPDLLVYATHTGNNQWRAYDAASNPHWNLYANTGTGFSTTPVSWSLPAGGYVVSNGFYSFNTLEYEVPNAGFSNGANLWSTLDMDGDGKPDLVKYQEKQNNAYGVYSVNSNPYWQVHLNTGSGFAPVAVNWYLPPGGNKYGGNFYSFDYLSIGSYISNANDSCQLWLTEDINGDKRPDIIVLQEKQTGSWSVYKDTGPYYWKVFFNTGSSFLSTPVVFDLPAGGAVDTAGVNSSFWYTDRYWPGNTEGVGSQLWESTDMNGDGKMDLVVYREKQTDFRVFGLGSNPHWKVYLNTNSFSGIGEEGEASSSSVYPNPAAGIVQVKCAGNAEVQLSVISSTGQTCKALGFREAAAIDISDLSRGMYFLRVQHEHGHTEFVKLIKAE